MFKFIDAIKVHRSNAFFHRSSHSQTQTHTQQIWCHQQKLEIWKKNINHLVVSAMTTHHIASYRSVGNSHEYMYIRNVLLRRVHMPIYVYISEMFISVRESATRHMSLSKEIPSSYPYMYLGGSLRVISMFPTCINISLFGFCFFFFFFGNCNIEDMSAYVFIPITTPATTIIIPSCSLSSSSNSSSRSSKYRQSVWDSFIGKVFALLVQT